MENPGLIFEILMNNERMFSLFQKTKILNHQKIKYRSLLSKNNYKEETPVFSYYILKSIMMFFYDFIGWCVENNRGSIAFNKTPENIKSLVSFIRGRFDNPEYLKSIDEFEGWFSQNGHKEGREMETLRMSVSDI
jgi:hypothetical protein